jgi:filamentous hemagglutinin family protein
VKICEIRVSAFAAAVLLGCFVLSTHANPVGPTVAQGTASFTSQGSHFSIQTSDRAFINWQSFNIGLGETTSFLQPSSSSLVWNQIHDQNPSQILGNLNANGYVVLQNASGFYIGGQASITAHGILLTTAPFPMPDLSGGGAWSFNAPPPTASIINYGQISLARGGSAFLIAHDVENHGTITAPEGDIGLYAGKQVLFSERPDGRGLSAKVTLPDGSVDNSGKLLADAGTIALHAQVVNQGGLIQANSVREVNGVIELVASDAINLGRSSDIQAKGDAAGLSPGGSISIRSDRSFADEPGSTITIVGGAVGGDAGQVEISASNLGAIQSRIDAHAATGFFGGRLTIDPYDLTLDSAFVSSLTPVLNGGIYQISLEADHDVTLSTLWTLSDALSTAKLTLSAGNNITFSDGIGVRAGNNWSVDLFAGTALPPGSPPTSGSDSIFLSGSAYLQTQNGNAKLFAPGQVVVNSGAIRTTKGGSINVTTTYGDVNTGENTSGFTYNSVPSPIAPYYYSVSSSLGGISTAAGGDVTINAGGNVTSYLPNSSASASIARADPGTGAFGPEPGNVTINAKGNVFGHYVLANGVGSIAAGVGSITAEQDIGSAGQSVALSLIKGSWNLSAPNGNIYLQEVRNPNGVFDQPASKNSPGYHLFDYNPNASVDLAAGIGVYLTGQSVPRLSNVAVPIIYPPSLDINAGPGGVVLENSVILFPSPNQNLNITTINGGGLNGASTGAEFSMSDSSQTRWVNSGVFGDNDHGAAPPELNNPKPVLIDISGTMEDIGLNTTKMTSIKVGGDMIGCNFSGENLHPGDLTSIEVTGRIFNQSSINSVFLTQGLPALPTADAPPKGVNDWEGILRAAVDPARIASEQVLGNISPSQYYDLYVAPALQFGSFLSSFYYNSATRRLTFVGSMDSVLAGELEKPLTVVRYGPDGNPLVVNGHIVTDTVSWADTSDIQKLYTASQGAPALSASTGGYQIGGPGQFNISAGSVSLGNTLGIISYGSGGRYANLAPYVKSGGAAIDVEVVGDLVMPGATIAALSGGNVKVDSAAGSMDLGSQDLVDVESAIIRSHNIALGIYSSGGGNVSVTAFGNINVDGSRIATFNGGALMIESSHGNVDAGSGGTLAVPVYVYYVDPKTGLAGYYLEQVYASGIVASTLVDPSQVPDETIAPGNITVQTPRGNIIASLGGILQDALNGNVSAGPIITLEAGSPGFTGNINLGESGVIGGTVNVTANGNVTGLIISRQNATVNAAQSFSGTVLSGGTANLSAGGTISGTVIGISGVNASGGQGVSASLISQNVSVGGGASQSTLGTTAAATSTSQAAAAQASSDTKEQLAADTTDDDQNKKKKGAMPVLTRKTGRVTVILPSS